MPSTFAICDEPLPYVGRLPARDLATIELVVIHCTELPDLATAREYGERGVYANGTGNSGHYYIDRDGTIVRYVPANRIAHHVRGRNTRSLGIELVNTGRWPNWYDSRRQTMTEPYPGAQIDALLALLAHTADTLPNLRAIAGHEDLDFTSLLASDDPSVSIRRKLDPGPLFPWHRVLAAGTLERQGP
jgi:N-acetylmuramoyl-L-alanine amidase